MSIRDLVNCESERITRPNDSIAKANKPLQCIVTANSAEVMTKNTAMAKYKTQIKILNEVAAASKDSTPCAP